MTTRGEEEPAAWSMRRWRVAVLATGSEEGSIDWERLKD
jgi:hypothetical protein